MKVERCRRKKKENRIFEPNRFLSILQMNVTMRGNIHELFATIIVKVTLLVCAKHWTKEMESRNVRREARKSSTSWRHRQRQNRYIQIEYYRMEWHNLIESKQDKWKTREKIEDSTKDETQSSSREQSQSQQKLIRRKVRARLFLIVRSTSKWQRYEKLSELKTSWNLKWNEKRKFLSGGQMENYILWFCHEIRHNGVTEAAKKTVQSLTFYPRSCCFFFLSSASFSAFYSAVRLPRRLVLFAESRSFVLFFEN